MKTKHWRNWAAGLIVTVGVVSGTTAPAQDSAAPGTASAATINAPVPQLAYGVPQILQLAQANMNDDIIIAYIKNAGISYRLNADQIIYLRQQGLSDAVINTMLRQSRAGVTAVAPTSPAPQTWPSPAYAGQVLPATTYVQTAPVADYYSQPCCYYEPSCYSYPVYGWYPPVTFYYGWGGVWGGGWGRGWGGGWRGGGYYGGGYRGGGFVGGGYHGGYHGGFGGGHGGGRR